MNSSEYDTVKAEKADAIRRYNRNIIFVFCLRLIVALAVLCSTVPYFPIIREICSCFLSIFNQQVFVFFLVNALVFIIYKFSATANSTSNIAAASEPDLYDQYVSLSSSSCHRKTVTEEEKQLIVSPAPVIESDENCFPDKHIVVCEKADSAPAEVENPVRDMTVSETCTVDTVTDQKMRFRRTKSEKYTVEKKKKSRGRELLRCETENGREVVVAGEEFSVRKSMQEMNNEEFRLTIESFIASKKKILRDENFAVVTEETEEESCFTAISYQ